MAVALRQGIDELSLTMKATLAVLALASGVYTYLGVRDLLDGTASIVFFGAIIYSAAVSVGIYTFWSFLIRFVPHVRERRVRNALYGAMGVGSLMIIAMSSWLNAAALAGSAALEQHLAEAGERYGQDLDQAHNNALAAQSLLPDIQLAADRFARLAEQERATGALTGTAGSGTVVQLLTQMSTQLTALGEEVARDREQVASLYSQGGQHLNAMRRIVSAPGLIASRGDAFAEQAVALIGVIAAMQETSIAPAVRRAADGLERSFIAPAAGGSTEDLRTRQSLIVGNVANAVAEEAAALARAADAILARNQVQPSRFIPLSRPEAVLTYAADFLPSWAGAISIDLMPAVLVIILTIVQGAIREREDPDLAEHSITAADMMRALRLYEQMRAEEIDISRMGEARAHPAASPQTANPPSDAEPAAGADDATRKRPGGLSLGRKIATLKPKPEGAEPAPERSDEPKTGGAA